MRSEASYDANGNTLSDASGKSYTWDYENRMMQAVVPGSGTVSFKYDPFGRRVEKSGPLGSTNYSMMAPTSSKKSVPAEMSWRGTRTEALWMSP